MNNLRIKVKYHNFEVELEGEKETVIKQFTEIKESGLGNLTSNVAKAESMINFSQNTIIESVPSENQNILPEYPQLVDIVRKDLPQSEKDWLVIYAFYASKYGANYITKDDLINGYTLTNRKTENRMKHFAENMNKLFQSNI